MEENGSVFLNAKQASQLLGLSVSSLAKWRLSGTGPSYSKLGRRVVYQRSQIEEWLRRNSHNSTSEYTPPQSRGGSQDV
jgi:predicted DNA-binding transcriptional regulator AlpA